MNDFDILVPAHGETVDQLERLLYSVFRQELENFKLGTIYLCSDNARLLSHFRNRCCVTVIPQTPHQGKPHALNLLLQQSHAPYCIQNSADCLPASTRTYHHLLRPFLHDTLVGAVTSRPEASNMGFMFLPNIVWKCHHFVQPKVSGELFAFQRHLVQPLPEAVIHDDAYIHHAIALQGYAIVYESKAVVMNAVPESFSEFFRQRTKNVIGNMQLGDTFQVDPPKNMRLRSLVLMAIELLANVSGRLDYIRGQIPKGLVGYNLPSTKEVLA